MLLGHLRREALVEAPTKAVRVAKFANKE